MTGETKEAKSSVVLIELVKLVFSLRMLQKKYFKTRDHIVLQAAKEKEKEVDRQVKMLVQSNPELFESQNVMINQGFY